MRQTHWDILWSQVGANNRGSYGSQGFTSSRSTDFLERERPVERAILPHLLPGIADGAGEKNSIVGKTVLGINDEKRGLEQGEFGGRAAFFLGRRRGGER